MTSPRTVAETTAYESTSLHADVVAFIEALAPQPTLHVTTMGSSAEGRDMPVLVLSADGRFAPEAAHEAARAEGRPVVLIVCNIHAGEVEGKEAALMLARDVTTGDMAHLASGATVVLIPIYNPDGNDRIDAKNRRIDPPTAHGQDGPATGVGTRYTGAGINLNRDYTKLAAVESRLLMQLVNAWQPHVIVDSHTSNGSPHAYALTYDTSHTVESGCRDTILYTRDTLLPAVGDALLARTGLRTFFYGNFRDNDEPTSGWESYPGLPRYGSHYRGLTPCLDILLEAYSYAPFRDRVHVTYEIFVEILDYAAAHGREIVDLVERTAADVVARGKAPQPDDLVGVNYGVPSRSPAGELVYDYPAYPLFDTDIAAWDLETMRSWRLEDGTVTHWPNTFYCRYLPEVSVRRPRAYRVPARETAAIEHLKLHNLELREVGPQGGTATVERFVILDRDTTASPDVGYETRTETVFFGTCERHDVQLAPGDILVPMDQPLANVAIYLLEPQSDDGLVRWGWFDHCSIRENFPVERVLVTDALSG